MPSWSSLFLLAHATLCIGALYEAIDDLLTTSYDFIIAGGGTAGNVIANRLSENPQWRILLVERGPSHEDVTDCVVPFFQSSLIGSHYDWNSTTTPQTSLNNRVLWYARGHILGGSSSINNMYYTRGASSDFDRYAVETGDPGWSWGSLRPYMKKNELWTTPADNHDTTGQFDPSVHGFQGTVPVSLGGHPQGISSRIIQTTQELPDEFPYNEDMNSGDVLGVGWLQSTIEEGKRSSSATAYLPKSILERPNLDVLVNTQVTRVLQSNTENGLPVFGAVEVAQTSLTAPKRIVASREIVLSAGVIGTPQILLNSGIGDEVELRAVGVTPIVNLPDVGKNFSDHVGTWNSWRVDSNDTTDDIQRDSALREQYFREWNETKTGPLVLPVATHLIFGRLPSETLNHQNVTDPSSGTRAPHYEIFTVNGAFPMTPAEGHYLTLVSLATSPISRGSVSLKSADPFEHPLIDPATLSSQFDRSALRQALKASSRFLATTAWKDYVIESAGGLPDGSSDEEIDEYITQTAIVAFHGVGTAAMSPKNASYGVVDPDLLVKGAVGLRVIDASVLPHLPSAHTQAPVYIVAERAADLIKTSWKDRLDFVVFQQSDVFLDRGQDVLVEMGNSTSSYAL